MLKRQFRNYYYLSKTIGLVVSDKATRVHQFQKQTVEAVYHLLAAAGLERPSELTRAHVFRRVDHGEVRSYAEIYPELQEEALLRADGGGAPADLVREWNLARADRF